MSGTTALTINIPTHLVPRIATAFAVSYGYQAILNGTPNPQSEIQFTRQTIINIIRQTVISYETQQARDAAQATVDAAEAQSSANITLT